MPQYALKLSLPPVFSADNFFVGDCNREAWQWLERWPKWPGHALLLSGPAGCGKSHLGRIWAARAGASIATPAELEGKEPGKGSFLIEDIEQVKDEAQLLHLFNYTRENKGYLLMTSTFTASTLPFTLPDLTSRLKGAAATHITEPGDDVLAGAMRKQFADRQMKVDDEVIAYVLPRMERSLSKIKELVEKIDNSALEQHKNVTIPFVRSVLDHDIAPCILGLQH